MIIENTPAAACTTCCCPRRLHQRHLKAYGGPGYDRLIVDLVPRLGAAGVSAEEIDIRLLVNPRRALTGGP